MYLRFLSAMLALLFVQHQTYAAAQKPNARNKLITMISTMPDHAAILRPNDTARRFGLLARTMMAATVKRGAMNDHRNMASIRV
jgi:hypothetical protein